jgi:nicotinamidase-related amidase
MPTARPTALVIIECQRGVVGDLSFLPALAEAAAPVLPMIGRLARGAREAGVLVAHLTFAQQAGRLTTNGQSRLMKASARNTGSWSAERPGEEVVPEIGVDPSDLVLPRYQGLSPVHRTETLTILGNLGIEEVVVAGASTNLAVPLVAAAATDENFAVTVPSDAVIGTPVEHHESMLRHTLPVISRIVTVDDLLKEWA